MSTSYFRVDLGVCVRYGKLLLALVVGGVISRG